MQKPFAAMTLEELISAQGHACGCGRTHHTGLQFLRTGAGVLAQLPDALRFLNKKKPFVVADVNTYQAAGEQVIRILKAAGVEYSLYVYPAACGHIEPDELAMGRLTMAYDPTCDVVLAVGSGVINDCCKVLAHAAHVPSMVVCTAPSMDGYASNSSSMVCERLKTSLYNACPAAILADIDIIKEAPMRMLWAGLGDMLAKYNALCEWRISHVIVEEYYCENIAGLMRASVQKIVQHAAQLVERDPAAVQAVVEGLILSGVAMDFAKISRPASGLEHYFSHMWEMEALRNGTHADLHGICVGVGLCLTLPLYEMLREKPSRAHAEATYCAFSAEKWEAQMRDIFGTSAQDVIDGEARWQKNDAQKHAQRLNRIFANWHAITAAIDEELPSTQAILSLMKALGMPTTPEELGLDAAATRRALVGSREIRDKYLLNSLLWDLGLLDDVRLSCKT